MCTGMRALAKGRLLSDTIHELLTYRVILTTKLVVNTIFEKYFDI